MDKLSIKGGRPLHGEVTISGAKNAALPILCASLLSSDSISLSNVPALNDIETTLALLKQLGVQSHRPSNGIVELNAAGVNHFEAPYELVITMLVYLLDIVTLLAYFVD